MSGAHAVNTLNASSMDQVTLALQWAVDVAASGTTPQPPPPRPTAEAIAQLPVGVLRHYFDQCLLGKHVDQGLDALLQMGILEVWLPEVADMVGFGDGEWRHKDVWKHTRQVVWQSVRRLPVRWGALLHDIGKLKTRSIDEQGHVHFFAHSEVGAAMFRKRVAKRLGFEGELYQQIHFLILHHLRASQYDGSWTDAAVRRFAKQMDAGLEDLLLLSRADITTKRPERKKRGLQQIQALSARIKTLEAQDGQVGPLPKGIGDMIMKCFALPPSRLIGDIKRALEAAINDGELQAQQPSEYYLEWVQTHRAQWKI